MKISFDDEIRVHLTEFVKSFVNKAQHDRWLFYLLEKPGVKANHELVRFYNFRDQERTRYLKNTGELNEILGPNYGSLKGVYFDGFDAGNTTLVHVLDEMWTSEILFSIKAGELALFLTHEFEIFLCQRNKGHERS